MDVSRSRISKTLYSSSKSAVVVGMRVSSCASTRTGKTGGADNTRVAEQVGVIIVGAHARRDRSDGAVRQSCAIYAANSRSVTTSRGISIAGNVSRGRSSDRVDMAVDAALTA